MDNSYSKYTPMVKNALKPEVRDLVWSFKQELEKMLPVSQIIVFGSQVKGTDKPFSDIDVCVVSPEFGHDRHAERMLLSRYSDTIDVRIEPHPFHPDDLADPWDSLAQEIRKYGVVISE